MSSIEELFSIEQRHQFVFFKIMEFCQKPKRFEELIEETSKCVEMQEPLYGVDTLLNWLTDAGALNYSAAVISEKGEVLAPETWEVSEEGLAYIKKNAPDNAFEKLLKNEPDYKDVFMKMLKYCKQPKMLGDIEQCFSNDETLARQSVQPTYVILMLERAGAVEWRNGWKSTNIGLKAL